MEEMRPLISGAIGGLIAILVTAWAAKDSKTSVARGTAVYGWRTRIMAIGASCLGLFIAYAAFQASPDQRLIAWSLGGASLLLSVLAPLEVLVTRFLALENGLQVTTPWRGTRTIPWQAITACNLRPGLEVHEIRTVGFGKIYLSTHLVGLSDLLRRVQHRPKMRAS